MVVLDGPFNGYRHIILPLAWNDEVLHRAVSVVAAHHLVPEVPGLMSPALAGQTAIISKLGRDSFNIKSSEIFTITNWATVLLLLVGETITGGNDFKYLLDMLVFLASGLETGPDLGMDVRKFVKQQTRM